jgi:hypothetical protein
MNRLTPPKKQPIPFAINGLREPIIPTTSPGDNSTSYNDGFPETTMTVGGLPPKGKGMNQILHELSDLSKWSSAGALNSFDQAFSTSIGGYPNGAILLGDDGLTIFISRVDNNLTNPNAGGAGWDNLKTYIIDGTVKTVNSNTPDVSGNVVLSAQDVGALPIIGGTVTGPVQVNSSIQAWRVSIGSQPQGPFLNSNGINIGDSDSGLISTADGSLSFFANGVNMGYWNNSELYYEGNISSNAGIYEQGQRVYSPNNPQSLSGYATEAWVNQLFVTNIRLASRGILVIDGAMTECPDGAVVTGGNGNEGTQVGRVFYRSLQKLVNNEWFTVSYT